MNKSLWAVLPPGWRRVCAGAAAWLFLWPLSLAHGQCNPVIYQPGYLTEMEPNNTVTTAQSWPLGFTVYGARTTATDPDFFRLEGLDLNQSVRFIVTPDTFNPRIRIWVYRGSWAPYTTLYVDEGIYCEPETAVYAGYDPCSPFLPVTQLALEVTYSGMSRSAHYLATAILGPSTVPVGDCCLYPIDVGGLPFSDTRDSSTGYRNMGLGPSPDVWYRLTLAEGGTLRAQTCNIDSFFDTQLWLLAADCQTVLAENDNSENCPDALKSWLELSLEPGTYYVVVEESMAGGGGGGGLFTLDLSLGGCDPVLPGPGALYEMEPNDHWSMAQPWPMGQQLYGEQTLLGDEDWFLVLGVQSGDQVTVSVEPDTFNPVVTAYAQTPTGLVEVAAADNGGFCQPEQMTFYIDPCILNLVPFGGLYVSLEQSAMGLPAQGHYVALVSTGPTPIPHGDCCIYPINVGAFPYTDTQNTGAAFRDHGFNASADVWYKLVLDQGGTLVAQTCGAATNFDTYLRVIDDDCATVLDQNDNSNVCGLGSTRSWLSKVLEAGTYYVMVEGAGNATGTYQLDLSFVTCNAVLPGPGALWELEPNNHWSMAQPWPVSMQLYGEQTTMGDEDWFRLDHADQFGQYTVTIEPDTFDPEVTAYVLTDVGIVPVGTANAGGFCESEQLTFYIDPCAPFVPIGPVFIEVTQSPAGAPMQGHYLGSVTVGPNPIPAGDCCQYPINVGTFPYTDTQNTGAAFRDHGFNASADVWYKLVLDQGGTLVAQTCGAATNFDTYLRVIDDDCATVLDQNDNSNVCGLGSTRSWLSKVLAAGTYYVMVEGAGNATGTYQLDLSFVTCNAVLPGPGALWELEPNNHWHQAQPWPMSMQLYGEMGLAGDPDWFLLESPTGGNEGVAVTIEPDTCDPYVRVYGLTAQGPQLAGSSDAGGFCQVESVTVAGWDPCTQPFPLLGWLVEVGSAGGGGMMGHYLGSALAVDPSVPAGDCCEYPLVVNAFPYTDTQNTTVAFRDMGFGAAPDVWYRLDLENSGVLTAQTCGGQTNFDTYLRLLDEDCATVLAHNDNSDVCGNGSLQSWLSACLQPGTYYVMVEGFDGASGTFTLSLDWRVPLENARLAVGQWGWRAETWHQRFTPEESTLRLTVDDACGLIERVEFYGCNEVGLPVLLGVDTDGHESRVATLPLPEAPGDGWYLDFDPHLLGPDPGPVTFTARLVLLDGSTQECTAESWYSPNLGEGRLIEELDYWELIHDDHITLVPRQQPGPMNLSLGWKLGVKVDEWSRDVPHEWQRPVSDTHCVPTSAAACLEWLDATYGTNVCGGLSGEELTAALGAYMGTNVDGPGTAVSDAGNGLQGWIDDHGGGYTVHVQQDGEVDDMQSQGEGQGQDVIVILRWNGGGAHAVTLSSFRNTPNEDGTFTVDFMDPWTGTTQEGNFNPNTGAFSGYGDGNASGSVGQVIYVCPVEGGPGGGGGGGGGSGWTPLPGPVDIPVPLGLWWLKMTFLDPFGKAVDLWNIVERRPAVEPQVAIALLGTGGAVRLSWPPVPDAVAYRIYRNMDGYFDPTGDLPYATVTGTQFDDPVLPGQRWCYRVTTVYPQ